MTEKKKQEPLQTKYIAVCISSVTGKSVKSRVPFFNMLIKEYDIKVIMLLKKVKFYNGKVKKVVVKDLPYLFNYAFLEVPAKMSVGEAVVILEDHDIPLKVLGVVNKRGRRWIDKRRGDESELDLINLGRKCKIGELVRIISGPFSGHIGVLKGKKNRNIFIIDLDDLQLQVSHHLIRGLEYGATDSNFSSVAEYIR